MFRDARLADRQRTAQSFEKSLSTYAKTAEKWFDGTVGSVDARLVQCDRLLHSTRFTVARLDIADSSRYLTAAERLGEDRRALEALRDDLLSGAANRGDVAGPPGWRTAKGKTPMTQNAIVVPQAGGYPVSAPLPKQPKSPQPTQLLPPSPLKQPKSKQPAQPKQPKQPKLAGTDQRWVTLESARFVAAHTDTLDDSNELATRAHDYAAMKTSTFTPARSAALCRAFVGAVVDLGRARPQPRVASSRPASVPDVPAEAMFL